MARAVVIGAGAAGLTAAAFLARDGCEVDVFEQAPHIGGVTYESQLLAYKRIINILIDYLRNLDLLGDSTV
jgi:protoporphyrinogen oxidase